MVELTQSVGVLIYQRPSSVLLVEHTEKARLPTGIHGFPAGRVEPRESLEETAVRELLEETGLETDPQYLFKCLEKKSRISMKQGKERFLFHLFICRAYSGELTDSDKTLPKFVSLFDLRKYYTFEDVQDISNRFYSPAFVARRLDHI